MRGKYILGLTCLTMLCPLSRSLPLTPAYTDSPSFFSESLAHGRITGDALLGTDDHLFTRDANWRVSTSIGALDYRDHQWLYVVGSAFHVVPPHSGETENPPGFDYEFGPVDTRTKTSGIYTDGPKKGAQAHAEHFDRFAARMVYVKKQIVIDDESGSHTKDIIDSYSLVAAGIHTENSNEQIQILSTTMGSDQNLPPTPATATGNCVMVCDSVAGTFALAAAVNGIPLSELIGAQIHLGAPGTNGPLIYDLGGQLAWTDAGDNAIARNLGDVTFPAAYMNDLLAGNTYLQIQTMSFPNGAIRGQLTVPEPSGLACLLLLALTSRLRKSRQIEVRGRASVCT